MGQLLFFMTNLFMKFHDCNFIFATDTQADGQTSPKQYAPIPEPKIHLIVFVYIERV